MADVGLRIGLRVFRFLIWLRWLLLLRLRWLLLLRLRWLLLLRLRWLLLLRLRVAFTGLTVRVAAIRLRRLLLLELGWQVRLVGRRRRIRPIPSLRPLRRRLLASRRAILARLLLGAIHPLRIRVEGLTSGIGRILLLDRPPPLAALAPAPGTARIRSWTVRSCFAGRSGRRLGLRVASGGALQGCGRWRARPADSGSWADPESPPKRSCSPSDPGCDQTSAAGFHCALHPARSASCRERPARSPGCRPWARPGWTLSAPAPVAGRHGRLPSRCHDRLPSRRPWDDYSALRRRASPRPLAFSRSWNPHFPAGVRLLSPIRRRFWFCCLAGFFAWRFQRRMGSADPASRPSGRPRPCDPGKCSASSWNRSSSGPGRGRSPRCCPRGESYRRRPPSVSWRWDRAACRSRVLFLLARLAEHCEPFPTLRGWIRGIRAAFARLETPRYCRPLSGSGKSRPTRASGPSPPGRPTPCRAWSDWRRGRSIRGRRYPGSRRDVRRRACHRRSAPKICPWARRLFRARTDHRAGSGLPRRRPCRRRCPSTHDSPACRRRPWFRSRCCLGVGRPRAPRPGIDRRLACRRPSGRKASTRRSRFYSPLPCQIP